MHTPARTQHPSLYEQLEGLPEGMTGEILDGQFHPVRAGAHGISGPRRDWTASSRGTSTSRTTQRPTADIDRNLKMSIYARFGVAYAWLIDPLAHTLEAFALEGGAWREIGRYAAAAQASVAPFDAVAINLADLWAPTG